MNGTKTRNKVLLAAACTVVAGAVTVGVAAGPLAGGVRGAVRSARGEAGQGALVRLSELLDRLDLSVEQRAEIRTVLAAHKEALGTLLDADVASHRALRAAIRQGEVDEPAVRAASATGAAVDADLAVERARILTGILPILTEEQRAEARAFAVGARSAVAGRLAELLGDTEGRAERLERIADRLDLTAAQRDEVGAIFAAHRGDFVRLLAQHKVTRDALHAAIRRAEVGEQAIRRAAATVAAVNAELAVKRAEVYAALYNVLTPEQQQRLVDVLATTEAAIAARAEAAINIARHLL